MVNINDTWQLTQGTKKPYSKFSAQVTNKGNPIFRTKIYFSNAKASSAGFKHSGFVAHFIALFFSHPFVKLYILYHVFIFFLIYLPL